MKIGTLSINQNGILIIILMILVILTIDNIVARLIETNILTMILIGLNLGVFILFQPYIRKEMTDKGKEPTEDEK